MVQAARPWSPTGFPAERGWPRRCGGPAALRRPSPPRPGVDGREEGGSGVRARREVVRARGRREGGRDGAGREEAAAEAARGNAVVGAGGLVGDGAKGVAGLVVAREERGSGGGGGELERTRKLGPAARPLPKRRAVSAKRQFPPGCGRNVAALITGGAGLRVGAVPFHGGFSALEQAAIAPSSGGSKEDGLLLEAAPANAGLCLLEKMAAADGGAPMVDGYHHFGPEAVVMNSVAHAVAMTDGLLENGVEGIAGLVVEERGRGEGSGELGSKKELLPNARLPPNRRLVSAKRHFPPGCGRDIVAPLASGGGGKVGLQLEATPADLGLVVSKEALATGSGGSVADQFAMGTVEVLSKGALDGAAEGLKLEGEVAAEAHSEVQESQEIAGYIVMDGSARGCHEASARYALGETKCVNRLQHGRKDSARAAENDLLIRSNCGMSLLTAAGKFPKGGRSDGIIQAKRVLGSDGLKGEQLGLAVGDSGPGIVKTKSPNMERSSVLIQQNIIVNGGVSGADGCLVVTHGEATSKGIPNDDELEDGDICTEADHVTHEHEVAGRHEGAFSACIAMESEAEEESCRMKRAPLNVAAGVFGKGTMRSKMITPRKTVRSPVEVNYKFPQVTLHRSCSKSKEEESAVTNRDSFAPRKKLKIKGSDRSNLLVNVASTSATDSKEELKDKEASHLEDDDILKALAIYEGKLELYLNVPSCVPSIWRLRQHGGQKTDARSEVRTMCRRFQFICRTLVQAVEQRSLKVRRVDLAADKAIRKLPGFVKHGPVVGKVPGVEVGDEFLYRVELAIVGLHRPYQGGIDTAKDINDVPIAISIVASGGYPDELSSSGEMIYTGSGGKRAGKKEDEDQKLERGNLALKNCIETKTPVRVIHGFKVQNREEVSHSKAKEISTFTYDGLYHVVDCWQEGLPGSRVFKYRLQRIPGQPELPLHAAKGLRKSVVRSGLCVADISQGKERIPICVINNVDNVHLAPFKYITKIKYPTLPTRRRCRGCDCNNGCSKSASCSCTLKNGGEIPFNFDGAVVHAKPLIFECGPSCRCPPSCHNRVSQHGIKIPLEVFRTTNTGWGVRSLRSIASGSFICEYVGELLHDNEANHRRNHGYLFDVGRNYDDEDLWKGLPSNIPGLNSSGSHSQTMQDEVFTIDAADYGNIGRFINHSCSPNLYAQNVLWDHGDKRMPHIMFFAAENIPPLQELTYDYNHKIGHVRDVNGIVQVKDCNCGSPQCCGRLY